MYKLIMTLGLVLVSAGVLAAGDVTRGEGLTATCVACHGTDGNSPAGSFPNIAGQSESYLYKQLVDIQSGARSAVLMTGILDGLKPQDLADLATYYAAQAPAQRAADPALVALGESIYKAGIARKKVAACTGCHSPTGQGNGLAKFPMLAGQWAEYTEAQLKAFRSGARGNDGDSKMMRISAMDLSDPEIKAVSSYIAGLRP
jgi:cytochrome c553|tara:strand:+ start:51223 stop:51828 length:606 start_codon:yes stop_codon:yes gene_type:complete